MGFIDRVDAGRQLAGALQHLRTEDVVVLGLPRGGVPVAAEVARVLGAPLDVIVVRKLGVPFQPELALGAVGEGDVLVLNERIFHWAHVSEAELAEIERRGRGEVERRARRFRRDRARLPLSGRTALLVDDGIATGATARAACQVARAQGAVRVVLAAPVCAPDAAARLREEVDELVCLELPHRFLGVGQSYGDFSQVADEEVADLLRRAVHEEPTPSAPAHGDPPPHTSEVRIPVGAVQLEGRLVLPDGAAGVIVFAHGSGSSRHSPRNRYVAGVLQRAGLATLLVDLLTPQEETSRGHVFDIDLLGRRLVGVTEWVAHRPECAQLPVGYFGASTGAAAALYAASQVDVAAVVSRGGRPDLAGPRLGEVRAPTLLIVGEHDRPVIELNRRAQARLRCENRLEIVPGATHLFEEPGTLELAAALARTWFVDHLAPVRLART
ncbi:phosphoribosyltransferase family protein [Actinomycetospora lemnae]|uniref:Phosphoribosyltransferase family protein n=1 Tax=Actinomycetospora lemnae TaxID=3019891 RepID=A0ABT5SRM5_9PSEU|nr:phosphoribosyltransferase family protein [Actinomycetospora sp. DW7H6]MDD7965439.1 phosphoribosyltransferase family protein [Actinomycetospora sp. DW7H6]